MKATIEAQETNVFPRFVDLAYPNIEQGKGVWLETTDGERILDACSGGAMVACLGHGVTEIVDAAAEQAEKIAYFYNHHFTSRPQEDLADRLIEVVAPRWRGSSSPPEVQRPTRPRCGSLARTTSIGDNRTAGV